MIKVRIQGTKEDVYWVEKQLKSCSQIKIIESSDLYKNKGTNKYYRKYIEICKQKKR